MLRHSVRSLLGGVGLTTLVLVGTPGMASATAWTVHLNSSGAGQARAQAVPSAPTGGSATCTSSSKTTVQVTWSSVAHASSYTTYESSTSSSTGYSAVASGLSGTSWTSPSLSSGDYWFEVQAFVGSNWASSRSTATSQRTISSQHCS